MPPGVESIGRPSGAPAERNRRTARLLLAWIVLLVAVSVLVIWVRN